MIAAHSELGASSMYRWSACPGSVRLCKGITSKSSSYAEEGTDAHDRSAKALRTNVDAWDVCDDVEMSEAVQVYLDDCREDASPDDVVLIEHRFDLSAVYPGCFGTADFVRWKPSTSTLKVRDYKHGAGIPVEAKGNPQLYYYALGALLSLKFPAEKVDLGVVQPRCNHPDGPVRNEVIDAIDLLDFRGDLIAYAKATEDPNAPLVTGEHCRFCPAAPTCPRLKARTQEVARLEFSAGVPYAPALLKEALDARPAVEAWLKAVDEFAYAEAERGVVILGHKLVAKQARRAWRDGAAPQIELIEGLTALDLHKPREILSPAQVEKIAGKKMYANHFAEFVTKESSGHVLVPESDKRPAIKVSAALEFAAAPL